MSPVARVVGVAVAVVVAVAASIALGLVIGRDEVPDEASADVGFARDMVQHHGQAVAMAELIRDRTDDPAMRTLALDIALTQQAQIGKMQGWLDLWDHPQVSFDGPMAWMGHAMPGAMPGMADPAEVDRLERLQGEAAEVQFLRLMRRHHEGGVQMADAALERVEVPEVRALAEAVVTTQTAEIDYLDQLLAERGATPRDPVPEMPATAATGAGGPAAWWWLVLVVGAAAVAVVALAAAGLRRRGGGAPQASDP